MTTTKTYPTVPKLASVGDLVDLFGVSRQWVDTMRWKKILLEPDGYIGRTPYWIEERAKDWWADRKAELRSAAPKPKG